MNRFQPTRAGIINMWDYRDEEFCFADGWLVLRGPNGSGKTKALEVLFPFVLDGRIDPKRLNPFAAEDRTMKSNLLFRGGENAVGYVWLELRHRGTGEVVTVGVGLHAARHRDALVRWHFVADGRVGADFSLITDDDRPMTRRQLAEEIGESSLHASPTDYRAAIDQRLFGLGRERYEQLLTLILTLRRPQLAKNLDPAKLSDTLTDGLRPVDDDLIAEAARSFDDMEAVATTLEGLTAADEATRTFLASYTTYLRTHARSAADALTRRREASTQRRRELADDMTALANSETGQARARARCQDAENTLTGLRARYDQLKSSNAYQAVEQLTDLERLVRTNEQTAAEAIAELTRRSAATAGPAPTPNMPRQYSLTWNRPSRGPRLNSPTTPPRPGSAGRPPTPRRTGSPHGPAPGSPPGWRPSGRSGPPWSRTAGPSTPAIWPGSHSTGRSRR